MQAPTYERDFYADDFIQDPAPYYAEMRALGPVIWLPQQNAYAVARHAEVVEVLQRVKTFISGRGISISEDVNKLLVGSTVNSDGDAHRRSRSITATPLMPKNIEPLEDYIRLAAQSLADRLVEKQEFDGVSEFAQILPYSIVIDLIGLNDSGRENMLKWAAATFDLMDGHNARSKKAFEDLVELRAYLDKYGQAKYLKEGGLARRIFDLAPENGFTEEEAAQLMRDYIAPSLDTTIAATGYIPYFFAHNPQQWEYLQNNPELVPNAVEEIVRLVSPIRSFARYINEDTSLSGVDLPEGERIMVVYGAANRDERVFENPDKFDITRKVRKHVGFGFGVHTCMGLHLARREMVNLIEAMRTRVKCWHIAGETERAMNNSIHAFGKLPVRVEPL